MARIGCEGFEVGQACGSNWWSFEYIPSRARPGNSIQNARGPGSSPGRVTGNRRPGFSPANDLSTTPTHDMPMSTYIRPRIKGASVFFTVTLAHRGSDLLIREIELLREATRQTKSERPFEIDAWVVLPDHLHCVWTLPEGDADYSTRWGAIKSRFTRALRDTGRSYPTELPVVQNGRSAGLKPGLRHHKRETAIWQRRFWEHHIRDDRDYCNHVEYCWHNPVRHGLVDCPEDWPRSSFHQSCKRYSDEGCGPEQFCERRRELLVSG